MSLGLMVSMSKQLGMLRTYTACVLGPLNHAKQLSGPRFVAKCLEVFSLCHHVASPTSMDEQHVGVDESCGNLTAKNTGYDNMQDSFETIWRTRYLATTKMDLTK